MSRGPVLRKRVMLLVVLLLVGVLGPAASQLMPPLFDDYEELTALQDESMSEELAKLRFIGKRKSGGK